MDNGVKVRPHLVNAQVKGAFRRRRIRAFLLPIGTDPHDVLAAQTPLVHPRRRDPHVTVFVPNRNVSTRSRSHLMTVDALHERDDLIARVKKGERLHRAT
jgi:hypothetical protein